MLKDVILATLVFWFCMLESTELAAQPLTLNSNSSFSVQFIGSHHISTGFKFKQTEVGGLSGIDYDPDKNLYYAISDDRGVRGGPPRIYQLNIALSDGRLKQGDVVVKNMFLLRDLSENILKINTVDPESVRLIYTDSTKKEKQFLWVSEGDARYNILPEIIISSLNGIIRKRVSLPNYFQPSSKTGIYDNLGLESLATDENTNLSNIFIATESALKQDGETATFKKGSYIRVVNMDVKNKLINAEYIYQTDPIESLPTPRKGIAENGLVELLWFDKNKLFTLERSYSQGVGNGGKLYLVDLNNATNVLGSSSILNLKKFKPVNKHLLIDFAELNFPVDNLEGMTWGPKLSEKELLLILVSDNNFRDTQRTQFLAFKLIMN